MPSNLQFSTKIFNVFIPDATQYNGYFNAASLSAPFQKEGKHPWVYFSTVFFSFFVFLSLSRLSLLGNSRYSLGFRLKYFPSISNLFLSSESHGTAPSHNVFLKFFFLSFVQSLCNLELRILLLVLIFSIIAVLLFIFN